MQIKLNLEKKLPPPYPLNNVLAPKYRKIKEMVKNIQETRKTWLYVSRIFFF